MKYKQFVLGVVCGAVIFGTIAAIATEYIVNPNPYPVKVNGNDVDIEGYNINDNTYFKLRDIGDNVGFGVDFQDDTVMINVAGSMPTPTPEPVINPEPIPWDQVPPAATKPNPKLGMKDSWIEEGDEFTSDGILIQVIDGEKYVSRLSIEKIYDFKKNGYAFSFGVLYKNKKEVINNIPDNTSYIEYRYYETVLRPYLQNNS